MGSRRGGRVPAAGRDFAWYTGGGNSPVEYAAPLGVADVPRMRDEEAPGFEVVEYRGRRRARRFLEPVGDRRQGEESFVLTDASPEVV